MNSMLKNLLKEKNFFLSSRSIKSFSKTIITIKQSTISSTKPLEKTKKFYLERDEVFHHTLPSFTGQSSAIMTWSAGKQNFFFNTKKKS